MVGRLRRGLLFVRPQPPQMSSRRRCRWQIGTSRHGEHTVRPIEIGAKVFQEAFGAPVRFRDRFGSHGDLTQPSQPNAISNQFEG